MSTVEKMLELKKELKAQVESTTKARETMLCHWPSYEDPELRTVAAVAMEHSVDEINKAIDGLDNSINAYHETMLKLDINGTIAKLEKELHDGPAYAEDPDAVCEVTGKIAAYKEIKELLHNENN